MPKLLAAKKYPAYVDVYFKTTVQDPDTGDITSTWHYEDPHTYKCNFMSLKGHSEKFGATYASSDTVKLEVSPEDAQFINLSMRFGNLRMRLDDTNEYYKYVGNRAGGSVPVNYYFNIDGMNPQVDNNGRIVSVEVYGKLAS
jgi:hypothetical protein